MLGRDLTVRRFSPQAEKQFDLLVADVGRPVGNIRHNLVDRRRSGSPLDLERLVAEVIAEVREQEREVREQTGRWHSLRVRPYLTLDNKVDGAMLVLVDIDPLKTSEQVAAAARDDAESIIATVRQPLLVLDQDLRVESANAAFYRTFRTASAETSARCSTTSAMVSGTFRACASCWARSCRGRRPSRTTRSITHSISSAPRRCCSTPRGWWVPSAEITASCWRSRTSPSESVWKRSFGNSVPTCRTRPNAGMNSSPCWATSCATRCPRSPSACLLLGRVQDDRPRSDELRQMLVKQTGHIGALLDQLLDIARVVSGKVELSQHRVDLADVVRSAVETARPVMEARKHGLTFTSPPGPGIYVRGDPTRLTQIVENLLTNALKYTDEGGQIAVALDPNKEKVRLVVRDTGIGMDAALLPHIFEVFTQAPRALGRAKGGLGLGLPLVKRLVELHGGEVGASSPGLGRGSEFVVTLPLLRRGVRKSASRRAPAASAPHESRHRRILSSTIWWRPPER